MSQGSAFNDANQGMQWIKRGIIFAADGSLGPWAQSHAMIPTPVLINPDLLRVYVTMCDKNGIGRAGFVDLDPDNPTRVLNVSKQALLDIGEPGTFDENGVLVCSVVSTGNGCFLMYYVGFELGQKIRYRLFTGAALSKDGGNTFKRVSKTPILDRSDTELYFRCGPFGLFDNGQMRLWYIAGSSWTNIGDKSMPVYDMNYLESADGISFASSGQQVLAIEDPDEHGFGRPWVVKRAPADYQLFFSVRKRSLAAYRMGYAESTDGLHWTRKDHLLNLDVSPDGFDSKAIMYAAVITVKSKTYCFYNGNDFGRDGFALAELVSA